MFRFARSIRQTFGVQLLQEPIKVPQSCEIMHVQISTTILHKLRFKNEWPYTLLQTKR